MLGREKIVVASILAFNVISTVMITTLKMSDNVVLTSEANTLIHILMTTVVLFSVFAILIIFSRIRIPSDNVVLVKQDTSEGDRTSETAS